VAGTAYRGSFVSALLAWTRATLRVGRARAPHNFVRDAADLRVNSAIAQGRIAQAAPWGIVAP
jgi:hypothetical protein